MQNECKQNVFEWRVLGRVLIKALVLFAMVNLLMAVIGPLPAVERLSAYNWIFPGRERFPFGEDPAAAYNFSLYSLDAMFASHRLAAGDKAADEYRVIVIGDSSTWGTLLKPEETLAGQLDLAGLQVKDARNVRFYNLGYPTLSLFKDLMVIERAMAYQPDLILWLVTLDSFPTEKQLVSPIVANHAAEAQNLIEKYGLRLNGSGDELEAPGFCQRTLIGQRRALADLARLQLYGVMWAATGIDQVYPVDYPPAQRDLEDDESFHDRQPPVLQPESLALDVLSAGMQAAGEVPVLLVNEPILISDGKNSDVRYNFYYPRWAYDQYRQLLADEAVMNGWHYVDVWNAIPEGEFTNSAIHRTPVGEKMLVDAIIEALNASIDIAEQVGELSR
ncbi:MAG: hypothetical protein RBT34_00685 [Anaerolineaceae bacterium]|jgi:hypothetical protein|nr:hypothetical protein [Anaerolineaceae bacterium]